MSSPRSPLAPLPAALLASLVLTLGCANAHDDDVDSTSDALSESSARAIGIVSFLNESSTTFEVLDDDVGLDRRAAQNIADRRLALGAFDSLADVDAVKYVGDRALTKLLAHVEANGFVPRSHDSIGSFDGVSFTLIEALRALQLVNTASVKELRSSVGLDSRAIDSIASEGAIATMRQLSELYYVGPGGLRRLKAYNARELGIISDLDRTVIPHTSGPELADAPVPGVAQLYGEIELRDGGSLGDTFYVTARGPDRIAGIDAWLDEHGLPPGSIDTGISPLPWIAHEEKVRDITAILEANPETKFVMFGDTSHVDHLAFGDIIELYPDRVVGAFVRDVKTQPADKLEGLHVVNNYAEVSAILYGLRVLDIEAARAVMSRAKLEGAAISDDEINDLLEQNH